MPPRKPKSTADIRHTANTRSNLPSAEDATTMSDDDRRAEPYYYERNRDLDPQLVWRGKDLENDTPLEVMAPPIYVQERIRPKHLIDDLRRHSDANPTDDDEAQPQMFADFNGLPSPEARTEFYQHQANWSNRMILGDSLQVMASLAEKEGLKGQVQCIYMDPPYGINFSSNWQWSTDSRVVGSTPKDITREPEQIRAFRDTWSDGINSYLSYLRDRLIVARELLTDSGSIFVQMGDENVHRVRALMDEVFGDENYVAQLRFRRAGFQTATVMPETHDYILWYCKCSSDVKFRRLLNTMRRDDIFPGTQLFAEKQDGSFRKINREDMNDTIHRIFSDTKPASATGSAKSRFAFSFEGRSFRPPGTSGWSYNELGMDRLAKAGRFLIIGNNLRVKYYYEDAPYKYFTSSWEDTMTRGGGKIYVVQTQTSVVQRCILMTTDPGDLILDPTSGAGTTGYVAEQWGRRWITIDTSRVALALSRGRLMGARYPYYVLADSPEGAAKLSLEEGGALPRTYVHIMIFVRDLCTIEFLISHELRLQTIPRSMSSGSGIRKTWDHSASSSTRPVAPLTKSGRFHATQIPAVLTRLA